MNGNQDFRAIRSGGAVRISIPASVANDLGSFQKSLGALAEQLGCLTCLSGVDCRFQLERDWLIGPDLELKSSVAVPQDPVPIHHGVTATLAPEVSHDLEKLQEAVANIADRMGCRACCSGFDITFRQELNFMVDERLNVRTLGGF